MKTFQTYMLRKSTYNNKTSRDRLQTIKYIVAGTTAFALWLGCVIGFASNY